MEVLRIRVRVTGSEEVAGGAERIVMLPFTGRSNGPLFFGEVLPGAVDTQHIHEDGSVSLSARYVLAGKDAEGKPCRLFIQNEGMSGPGRPLVTTPVVRTDSESLRWLEKAHLTGRIENVDGYLDIVISSEDAPGVTCLTLRRDGLRLQGRLEKKVEGPCPLVLMLHGFGGDMGAVPGAWFQRMSDDLTSAGLATLRFDFDGHGRSDGRFCDMTPYSEIEDAMVYLKYALKLPDVTEVYLLGHSQGGVVAGMLAGYCRDLVKKLVLLAPAASLKTDAQQGKCMAAVYDPDHIPKRVDVGGGREVGGLFFRMAQTLPVYEVTGQFTGPSMVVLPGQDVVVTHEGIARYAEVLPDCRLLRKETLDHGLGGSEHEETMTEVVRFLAGA